MFTGLQLIELAFFLILVIGGGGFIVHRENHWRARVDKLEAEIEILMHFARQVDPKALAQAEKARPSSGPNMT